MRCRKPACDWLRRADPDDGFGEDRELLIPVNFVGTRFENGVGVGQRTNDSGPRLCTPAER